DSRAKSCFWEWEAISSSGMSLNGRVARPRIWPRAFPMCSASSPSDRGMAFVHEPVLLQETVDALVDPFFGKPARRGQKVHRPVSLNGVFVDGTFGRGGHARELLRRLGPEARLFV